MTRTRLTRKASRIASMAAALIVAGLAQPTMLRAQTGNLPDLYVISITGPDALQAGLSGTYEVRVGLQIPSKSGITRVPLELHIVFAGTLDQTDRIVTGTFDRTERIVADGGLECQVGHDVGINAVVRCTGQIEGERRVSVVVQGRGHAPGVGKLVATVNASRLLAEDLYTNNLLQKNTDIQ